MVYLLARLVNTSLLLVFIVGGFVVRYKRYFFLDLNFIDLN